MLQEFLSLQLVQLQPPETRRLLFTFSCCVGGCLVPAHCDSRLCLLLTLGFYSLRHQKSCWFLVYSAFLWVDDALVEKKYIALFLIA